MRFRILSTLCGLALSAGCLSTSEPTPRIAVPIEQTTFATSLGVDLASSTKLPSGLYYRDITVGTGTTLAAGQAVGMHYTGYFANGQAFDSRLPPETPYSFVLGAGNVIQGWDLGLVGMKVGGRRQLIIPPELGYGSQDYLIIPGNSVLVFTVDAVTAQ